MLRVDRVIHRSAGRSTSRCSKAPSAMDTAMEHTMAATQPALPLQPEATSALQTRLIAGA